MMNVAFLLGGYVGADPDLVGAFCAEYPEIRDSFERTSEYTGLPVADILTSTVPEENRRGPEWQETIGLLCQAALATGIYDTLIAHGLRPHAIGGLSLGARIAACLAGSVDRKQLFEMLHFERLVPPAPVPQALAALMIPATDDPRNYYGLSRPGIHLGCDHGVVHGEHRRIVVGGTVQDLEDLVNDLPADVCRILDTYQSAFHTPLRRYALDTMAPFMEQMTFLQPEVTLLSPLEPKVLETAEEVREFYVENNVKPVLLQPLIDEMTRIGTQQAVALGPGFSSGITVAPIDLIRVQDPSALADVLCQIGSDALEAPR